MATPWNDDPQASLPLIAQNVAVVATTIQAQASARVQPTTALAQDWHRMIYQGVPLPVAYYAGEIRDSDPAYPELIGYDVVVAGLPGVDHTQVPGELTTFESGLRALCETFDRTISSRTAPTTASALAGVIRFSAFAHGEWVRIHPFANGNGRVARCWANFIALRYGLPAIATIKPRPADLLYGQAARASMLGNHGPTQALFAAFLSAAIAGP